MTTEEEIAYIEELLNSGVTQTSMDGQTTTFDRAGLERRLVALKAKSLTHHANRQVRPMVMRPNYGRA